MGLVFIQYIEQKYYLTKYPFNVCFLCYIIVTYINEIDEQWLKGVEYHILINAAF
ncbi:hypothetical protein [Jeotgalibacillus campisalis]|uniref:Uncharacterized protein n=1 Tax=Jeotgalibacillus campisalis TaxID=220754 RepID=A0A0C2S1N2_9BACL|nr:hypothetical protein [Jeotgalibacillus campisalis]KIL47949.1 hypothetical protein KR50_21160 [Jeotgalibacillus campisalis]